MCAKYYLPLVLTSLSVSFSAFATHREPLFENSEVQVWKTIFTPHEQVPLHRHDNSRIIVVLKGGLLRKLDSTGTSSIIPCETGHTYWINPDPPNVLSGEINESNETIEMVIIQFRKEPK